jgi:hypothetical protein
VPCLCCYHVVLHWNKKYLRISHDFLLLLGALFAATSLLLVGGSYFALTRGQGMLSLMKVCPVGSFPNKSGQRVFVAPGDLILGLTQTGFVLAVMFTVLIGYMAFQRYGKYRSISPKINLIFLAHVEKLCMPDFTHARSLRLLSTGSEAVADNVVQPGAPEYREFSRSDSTLKSYGISGLIQPGDIPVRF